MSSSVESLVNKEYKYGFVTDIESDVAPKGLSEDVIRLISAKKSEPEWLLEWRLKAYRRWLKMTEPHHWPNVNYPPIDYQSISYYSAPRTAEAAGQPGRGGSRAARDLREARHPADASRSSWPACRRGRDLRQRVGRHDVQGQAGRAGDHLLLVRRGGARASRAGAEVPRLGGAGQRQLLRRAQLRGVHRRVVRVHPEGRALPDGAVHLFPHQHARRRASSSAR